MKKFNSDKTVGDLDCALLSALALLFVCITIYATSCKGKG